jgi:hypothetical protein
LPIRGIDGDITRMPPKFSYQNQAEAQRAAASLIPEPKHIFGESRFAAMLNELARTTSTDPLMHALPIVCAAAGHLGPAVRARVSREHGWTTSILPWGMILMESAMGKSAAFSAAQQGMAMSHKYQHAAVTKAGGDDFLPLFDIQVRCLAKS